MTKSTAYDLPESVWQKWAGPEYDGIRQAVLVFGGHIRKEAVITSFAEVSFAFQEGETTNTVKGVLYLTTRRIVFLPKNTIPHPQLIQAQFSNLRCLSGNRNDLMISISDTSSAAANFKFPTVKALYQCFNSLRKLCEAIRADEEAYRKATYDLATAQNLDETPFASIECDLSEVDNSAKLEVNAPQKIVKAEEADDPRAEPVIELLSPVQKIGEKFNQTNFDIHIKLRILFIVSLVSFLLKFIPFFPLTALVIIGIQIISAWINIKKDRTDDDDYVDADAQWKGHPVEGTYKVLKFFNEWFMWQDPRKSASLFQASFLVFVSWAILPTKIYVTVVFLAFSVFLVKPLLHRSVIGHIVTGFWFST
ncbi:hypothetical protein TVAG_099340 [Trichomonas vaginalis G3]|uniref:GRAM domain-containing protein n=1 Tax=Trichomonas vaginalis (strain ATCC PRA-98 / G3) TaxID=412133 RepID=A2G331_TRIV3|nr:hypothetical protein TVAGG3_0409910 [Trichomonas vaginalis G3]EAX88442.1 hypothetical protein TVAG_099340 [Trichomonas vaginalis G3]KAI5535272.1 hypothetical protein TVAGG3_0409910 [Trichomonas vaginalis G3]|eukprot:XP_001301372.1 hypothetical protein [Trichomonas vaginalis G3]